MVQTGLTHFVIDVGPDFRQQMLMANVSRLDAVLLTHEHKDHTAGIDDLRAFNYLMKKPIPILAEQRVLSSIKQEYQYIFADERYPGAPQLELEPVKHGTFTIHNQPITAIRVYHGKLPIFGYRVGDMAYLTDIKTIDPADMPKLTGLKVLILSAIRVQPHCAHLGLDEALELVSVIKPQKTFLTHISHAQHPHSTLLEILLPNISPAYDGLIVNV